MKIDKKRVLKALTRPMRLSQIAGQMKLDKRGHSDLRNALNQLRKQGRVVLLRDKRYALAAPAEPESAHAAASAEALVGRLSVTARGFAFVRPETDRQALPSRRPPDIFIPRHRVGEAIHGDMVLVRILKESDPARPEGRVLKVVERGLKTLVGRYHNSGRGAGMVVPREQRIQRNIHVMAPPPDEELADGSWVLVRLLEYPPPPDDLIGEIAEVIGDDETTGINVLLVLSDYGIVEDFPNDVVKEVGRLPADVTEDDMKGRKDLRGLMSFTIDGYNAKDFDDALSIEPLPGGGCRLYVHIADVSHYVTPDSAIDEVAQRRSTSIYPVDRVVPMLPEKLSNDLCSLRPHKDRLAVTVEMELAPDGAVKDAQFYDSVIQSQFRATYRDVQSLYEGIENPATQRLKKIGPELGQLLNVMGVLRKRRMERGALDMDIPEVEIEFDEEGDIVNVVRAPRWQSHQVIEECMILANEVVARHLRDAKVPILYRVHDEPERDLIDGIAPLLDMYGISVSPRMKKPIWKQLQDALAAVSRFEAPHILNRIILQAMSKARYSPGNIGHFGLGSECYCHFTSPIRRYPDLTVHRALKRLTAEGKPDKKWLAAREELLPDLGEHCSDRERMGDSIENEVTRICSLEFMRRYLGDSFAGHVSGVAKFGLFVELQRYPVDGLLHVRDLRDDHYEFDDATMTLRGRRSRRVFRLGQKVEVSINRVDVINQEMDLRLTLLEDTRPPRGSRLYQSRRRKAW